MSFHTPDGLKDELADMRDHLDSRQYGHGVTENAKSINAELNDDYTQIGLEKLLASYRETFPHFYEEDPVNNTIDYLEEFESLDKALKPLEDPK
jgi:hypothetical protein